jgi:hypothetical protein
LPPARSDFRRRGGAGARGRRTADVSHSRARPSPTRLDGRVADQIASRITDAIFSHWGAIGHTEMDSRRKLSIDTLSKEPVPGVSSNPNAPREYVADLQPATEDLIREAQSFAALLTYPDAAEPGRSERLQLIAVLVDEAHSRYVHLKELLFTATCCLAKLIGGDSSSHAYWEDHSSSRHCSITMSIRVELLIRVCC